MILSFPWLYILIFALCLAAMVAAPFAVYAKRVYARLLWVFIALLAVATVVLAIWGPRL